MRVRVGSLVVLVVGGACGNDGVKHLPDAPKTGIDASVTVDARGDARIADAPMVDTGITPDAPASIDARIADAPMVDMGITPDAPVSIDAMIADASMVDMGITPDAPAISYNCGAFSTNPGWTITTGFHAVTIADATMGISQPVALAIAGGGFGGKLYVVNQGDNSLRAVDTATGNTQLVVANNQWPVTVTLTTSIAWDEHAIFDGNLYIGDQGGDGDQDSRIYRVAPNGATSLFTTAPGPGLDDVFGLAFTRSAAYGAGLYATGDTDGAAVDWGRFDAAGVGTAFSEVTGSEGIAFDPSAAYGGLLYAARPGGGGYAGDNTISSIGTDGTVINAFASNLLGIHAVTFAPPGAFNGMMHAASWSTGQLISITPAGVVSTLASGLTLSNYDGNSLAFSPDGRVLYVADRSANRIVCIEPVATP